MIAPAYKVADLGLRVVVGVSDMVVCDNPAATLSTYALGSCIGVVAYDAGIRVGGILHFMLPDSKIMTGKAAARPAMFADTGLPLLMHALAGARAKPERLRFMITGGASVLSSQDAFKIGARNAEATINFFSRYGFIADPVQVGGQVNRTVHLEMATGIVTLKCPLAQEIYSLAR